MAVTFEKVGSTYRVSREFKTLGAAAAGAAALESVSEAAFGQPFPTPAAIRELTPAAEALLERGDEEAPLAHLKHGEAYHGTSSDEPLNLPRVDEGS